MAIIILDPGHGGEDTGACGFGLKEKDLNLSIALRARTLAVANGHEVHLTRVTDMGLSLSARGRFSVANKGDVFVSIHHDAGPPEAHGCHAFFDNPAATNAADLAELVAEGIAEALGIGFSWGGPASTWRYQGKDSHLGVLVGGDNWRHVTACLVECCFITNAAEAAIIKGEWYMEAVARGIVAAIHAHLELPAPLTGGTPVAEGNLQANGEEEVSPWAAEAQQWVKAQGISDGTRPKAALTREEAWCYLMRLGKALGDGEGEG
jgi:N-acetylmuramoyl-L-alanine amidase